MAIYSNNSVLVDLNTGVIPVLAGVVQKLRLVCAKHDTETAKSCTQFCTCFIQKMMRNNIHRNAHTMYQIMRVTIAVFARHSARIIPYFCRYKTTYLF